MLGANTSGKPQIKIARFSSGQFKDNYYDYKVELLATEKIQIRHNALESARLPLTRLWQQPVRPAFFISESLSS